MACKVTWLAPSDPSEMTRESNVSRAPVAIYSDFAGETAVGAASILMRKMLSLNRLGQ
jgi:hypothetical protein